MLLGPTLSLQLFGSWLLIDLETDHERLNEVIHMRRVTDVLVNLMPFPPDNLFDKSDTDFFVDPFDMP
jgi:hypothetical protein